MANENKLSYKDTQVFKYARTLQTTDFKNYLVKSKDGKGLLHEYIDAKSAKNYFATDCLNESLVVQ